LVLEPVRVVTQTRQHRELLTRRILAADDYIHDACAEIRRCRKLLGKIDEQGEWTG